MDIAVRWRTILPYATQLCVSAVDRLMAASGGGAILNTSPLQRCFRDVHGAAAHAINDYDIALQILGRHLLGIEPDPTRSEEHTSELQSLMRISYAVFCLKKKTHASGKYYIIQKNYIAD